jgi:hypothetical protein
LAERTADLRLRVEAAEAEPPWWMAPDIQALLG